MANKYLLKASTPANHPRVETSFDIAEPFALAQQGLPASYAYSDYIYVIDDWRNVPKLTGLHFTNFKKDLAQLVLANAKEYIPHEKRIRDDP